VGLTKGLFLSQKADIQITQASFRVRPKGDLAPVSISKSRGRWPACRVAESDWIDRREGTILGVSVEISQISEPNVVVNLFLYLLE